MELSQAVGRERAVVLPLELGQELLLAALVQEVVAHRGLVLLQPADEFEPAVDGTHDLVVGGRDLGPQFTHAGVRTGVALHQAKI